GVEVTHAGADLPDLGRLVKRHRIERNTDMRAGRLAVEYRGAAAGSVERVLHRRQVELVEIGADLELLGGQEVETGPVVLHVLPAELIHHPVVAVAARIELVEGVAVAVFGSRVAGSVIV